MKIHIAGMAGSGKTTLARSLSERFGIQPHDLDFVVYDTAAGERHRAEIERSIDELRGHEAWVTEGAYHDDWLQPLLDDATAIAWLDVPLRTSAFRIVRRHIRAELARNNVHPGWMRLYRFINYNRRTARRQRWEIAALLAPYGGKVSRCRSSRDVAAFETRIGDEGGDSSDRA